MNLMEASGILLSQSNVLTGSTTIQADRDIKGRTDKTELQQP